MSIKLIEQDGGKELEVHYVRESLAKAGFKILKSLKKHMWIPVEIVVGVKESDAVSCANLSGGV